MTALIIRNLNDALELRLRAQASRHGVSVEDEAVAIISRGLQDEVPQPDDGASPAAVPETRWHLKVTLDELMRLSVKPDRDFDQKTASDELYSYLDEE